jgi:exodeoxyribonuclease VII large subunit
VDSNNIPALSVSALTSLIKDAFNQTFPYLNILGEVSNFRPSSTGHWYFSLKDNNASISVVMFKNNTWKVDRLLKEGDKIQIFGTLDVYAPRGTYSIKCDKISFIGTGDILANLEKRKQAYNEAGWFDESLKKPICKYPTKIGVVTSPTTAALQDILQVLNRRAPFLDVVIIPCVVQGENAAPSIAKAIEVANTFDICDQLIVSRGGGSIEDLLPFSEEVVLKAILESDIPIISGVGHEIDFALSDFVSDLRAPTPSAAAELASSGYNQLISKREDLEKDLNNALSSKVSYLQEKVNKYDLKNLNSLILSKIENIYYRSVNATNDIELAQNNKLRDFTNRYNLAKLEIDSLNPKSILKKGYSIVRDKDNKIINSKNSVKCDADITITFIDGDINAKVGK